MTITPDTMPTAVYLGPRPQTEPRFPTDASGVGAIHPCDPDAVARLHALLGTHERRAARAQLSGLAAADCGDLLANLDRSMAKANRRRAKALTDDQLRDAAQRHQAGENWRAIAGEYGMSASTLMKKVAAAGHSTSRAK